MTVEKGSLSGEFWFRFAFRDSTEEMKRKGMRAVMTVDCLVGDLQVLRMKDWIVRDGRDGLWPCPPSRRYQDRDGKKRYADYCEVFPVPKHGGWDDGSMAELKRDFEAQAIREYWEWKRESGGGEGAPRPTASPADSKDAEIARLRAALKQSTGMPQAGLSPTRLHHMQQPDSEESGDRYAPTNPDIPADITREEYEGIIPFRRRTPASQRPIDAEPLNAVLPKERDQTDVGAGPASQGNQPDNQDGRAETGSEGSGGWVLPESFKPPIPKRG